MSADQESAATPAAAGPYPSPEPLRGKNQRPGFCCLAPGIVLLLAALGLAAWLGWRLYGAFAPDAVTGGAAPPSAVTAGDAGPPPRAAAEPAPSSDGDGE